MSKLQLLISEEEIAKKIYEIAQKLKLKYEDQELVLVAILKGSICLVADLMRQLDIPLQLEFIRVSSYGMHGKTPGKVQISMIDQLQLADKAVLLIDDIYDTGKTLSQAVHALKALNPKSLETLVLLKKKIIPKVDILPTYVCFDIENHFIVGYGLDYKEQFRGLKAIYQL